MICKGPETPTEWKSESVTYRPTYPPSKNQLCLLRRSLHQLVDLLELLVSSLQCSGKGVEAELGLLAGLALLKVFQNQLGKALAFLFELDQRERFKSHGNLI